VLDAQFHHEQALREATGRRGGGVCRGQGGCHEGGQGRTGALVPDAHEGGKGEEHDAHPLRVFAVARKLPPTDIP